MKQLTALSPKQLRRAADLKERIEQLQAELTELLGASTDTSTDKAGEDKPKRRKFSAAAKAKMAKAQKERWAKLKAVKKEQPKT
jgi:ElaB/YqjD/DUF883 family membrane-anchored ribosome-binding protein